MSLFVDFVGLNTLVSSSFITGSTADNTLSSARNTAVASIASSDELVGINLHRNGPYGYSSWTQLRVSENPITRYHNKNSIMTFITQPGPNRNLLSDGELRVRDRYSAINTYNEPAIAQKCFPLVWGVGQHRKDKNGNILSEPHKFSIISSMGNKKIKFANLKTDELHKIKKYDDHKEYDQITSLYLDGGLNSADSPITYWEFVQYRETVFPHMKNQFQNENLERPNFVSFYRHDRPDRTKVLDLSAGKITDFGYGANASGYINALSQSTWPMDEHERFLSRSYHGHKQSVRFQADGEQSYPENLASFQRNGEGTLMTTLHPFNDILVDASNAANLNSSNSSNAAGNNGAIIIDKNLSPGPLYMRRTTLKNVASVSNPSGMLIPETGSLSENKLFQGGALWEAGVTREVKDDNNNYVSSPKNPFYDSYEDYIEEARRKYKNFSVLPEFRMSTQIEDYLINQAKIEIDMLDVTGGAEDAQNSSQSQFFEIYTNSDFMRQFELINEDHRDISNAKVLSLRCKAVKKFLPYEGFYPCQRTVDLAKRFYNSFKDNITLFNASGAQLNDFNYGRQLIMTPLFAPGILFNSIKSGIAVDYPIVTGSLGVTSSFGSELTITSQFDRRIPFEALIDPQPLANLLVTSNEPHPSGNLSASAQWDGGGDQLYSMMANNFFAEIPEFFLPNGNFSSVVSKPQGEGIILENGKVYGMRVFMGKSYDKGRIKVFLSGSESRPYSTPQDFVTSSNDPAFFRENFTMYSRPSAFGPPSLGRTRYHSSEAQPFLGGTSERLGWSSGPAGKKYLVQDSRYGYNYPFTPPYYHGEAWCDMWITGSGEPLTIKQIQSKVTASFLRFDGSHYSSSTRTPDGDLGPQSVNNTNRNAVQLTSSLNMFFTGKTTTKNSAGSAGNLIVDTALDEDARWVIQTKFETPMLNFSHISVANNNLTVPVYGSESVPRGMWHQYGRIPENNEGVFMGVKEIEENWQFQIMGRTEPMENLADSLGFSGIATKLGRIRSNKKIFEAVVAVPFFEEDGKRKFFLLDEEKVRLYLEGPNASNAEAYASLTTGDPKTQIGRTVLNQMEKMKKYIFPPSFDFINNEEIDPIAMYIFEFSHTLSQQDLSDIWQNLPPDIGTTMEVSEAAITHPILKKELLGSASTNGNLTTDIPNELKWMVFKVKQRAASNYYKKTVKRNPMYNSPPGDSDAEIDEYGLSTNLQYNWPYDFFSLVELVKIDSEIEFGNFDLNELANYVDSIPAWSGQSADEQKIFDAALLMEDGIVATAPADEPPPSTRQAAETVEAEPTEDAGLATAAEEEEKPERPAGGGTAERKVPEGAQRPGNQGDDPTSPSFERVDITTKITEINYGTGASGGSDETDETEDEVEVPVTNPGGTLGTQGSGA